MLIIPGFPAYRVTNSGEVYSNKRGTWRKLSPAVNSAGYYHVNIYEGGRRATHTIHRLLSLATWGDYVGEINHKDGNKLNNNILNLEIVSRSENIQHSWDVNLRPRTNARGASHGNTKVTPAVVEMVLNLRRQGLTYQQMQDKTGCSKGTLGRICGGKTWVQRG